MSPCSSRTEGTLTAIATLRSPGWLEVAVLAGPPEYGPYQRYLLHPGSPMPPSSAELARCIPCRTQTKAVQQVRGWLEMELDPIRYLPALATRRSGACGSNSRRVTERAFGARS